MTIFVGPNYSIPASASLERSREDKAKVIKKALIEIIRKKSRKYWTREELVSALKKKKIFDEMPFRFAMCNLYLEGYFEYIYKDNEQYIRWQKNQFYQGWPNR